jgi:hypothetical protein
VNATVAGARARQLSEIEGEIGELQRQVGSIAEAGTDFAIRIDRRSTTLIAAVEEVRAAGPPSGSVLPREFWARTAEAITALTAIRGAARATLSADGRSL